MTEPAEPLTPGDVVRERGTEHEMTVATFPFTDPLGDEQLVGCEWAAGEKTLMGHFRVERLERVR